MFATYFLWFIIYCFIGWIYESAYCSICERKLINRGFLTGPIIPIYGCGAMVAILLFGQYTKLHPVVLFLLCGTVDCLLEYVTSWVMEKLFHARWWDYSSRKFNLNGRVCLLGFTAFGAMSVLLLRYVHPLIASFTDRIPIFWLWLMDGVLFVLLVVDTAQTVYTVLSMNNKLDEIQNALDRERERFTGRLDTFRSEVEGRLAAISEHLNEHTEAFRAGDPDSYRAHLEERMAAIRRRVDEWADDGDDEHESRAEALLRLYDEKKAELAELSRESKENMANIKARLAQHPANLFARWTDESQHRLVRAFPTMKHLRRKEAFLSMREQFTDQKQK